MASLANGFVVRIVQDNLTEEDAYQLEHELIADYGKRSEGTGPLLNITDGGEHEGVCAELRFDLGAASKGDEATESLCFSMLLGEGRDAFAKDMLGLLSAIDAAMEPFFDLEEPPEPVDSIACCIVNPLTDLARKLLRRRVTCEDMAYQLMACYEDLDWIADEVEEEPSFLPLLSDTAGLVNRFCHRIGLDIRDFEAEHLPPSGPH